MKSLQRILLMSAFAFVFSWTHAEAQQEGATQKAGKEVESAKKAIGKQAEQAGKYVDDAEITAKVKAAILKDPKLKVFQISVTTADGVVKLSGEVDSNENIKRSMKVAQGVKGVKSVENELVVKGVE